MDVTKGVPNVCDITEERFVGRVQVSSAHTLPTGYSTACGRDRSVLLCYGRMEPKKHKVKGRNKFVRPHSHHRRERLGITSVQTSDDK